MKSHAVTEDMVYSKSPTSLQSRFSQGKIRLSAHWRGASHETLGSIGSLVDVDGPFAEPSEGIPELVSDMSDVGPDKAVG